MPAPKNKPAPARTQSPEPALDLHGELRQLAAIRTRFPPLSPELSAALLAQHDAPSCRERGGSTRAADTFRGAMSWARTIGASHGDPAVQPAQARWFLDCLTTLGTHFTDTPSHANPTETANLSDAQGTADALLIRTRRRLRSAVGTRTHWTAALDAALSPHAGTDERVTQLGALAKLIESWLAKPAGAPPLAAYRVTAETVTALHAAATTLDEAIAHRAAPKQFDHDSPDTNTAEGRLYFAMRALWDDASDARDDGTSSLQYTLSPALLRGLNLHRGSDKSATKG